MGRRLVGHQIRRHRQREVSEGLESGRPQRHADDEDLVDRDTPTYMAPKVTASAVRSVRKRNVLVLNDRFRPKRSKNGLYHSHTARNGAGNSTGVAPRHPGSLFRPPAHLLAKPRFSPFCLIWGLSLGVSLSGRARDATRPPYVGGARSRADRPTARAQAHGSLWQGR